MAYTTLADDLKELHHPKTWVGKYVWSQDHKVIAVQYMITAIAIGLAHVDVIGICLLEGLNQAIKSVIRSHYR